MGRDYCWDCRRPKCVCLCETFSDFRTDISIIILAHPREARRGTSSGLLAHRSLPNSKYIVDFNFQDSKELQNVIEDLTAETYLLYPRVCAVPVSTMVRQDLESTKSPIVRQNLVVIEGTWAQARTILNHSPKLQELQAVTLNRPRLSRFQIRSQPKLHCLSTIEAIAYALNDLGEFGDQRAEIFLKPFFSMVDQHINYQKRNRPRFRRTVKTST